MRTLLALALCVFAATATAEDWSRQFPVTGTPELRVETDDANVFLHAGSGGMVEARVTTHGWTIGSNGVKVNARQNGDRIEIEVRVPQHDWGLGNRSVRVDLRVPTQVKAEVRTGDGNVVAQGLKGEFRFNTGDGAIEAESLDGALTARTGDGKLTARGRFDLLDFHTGDGAVFATANPGSKPAAPWRIETGDGDVTLRVPEGFAAEVDASTGDGEISVHLPITSTGFRSGEHSFRGRLNGGGPSLRIRTGDGSIRLERL